MSKLVRYTCVANDHDAMESNPNGDYVRFDYANLRIEILEKRIEELETMCDNAHEALCAVKDSGAVREDDVMYMIDRGLDNKPQSGE